MLSKMTGTATIIKQNNSYSGNKFGFLGQVSVSTAESQRPLLTADEVMRLPAARKDAQGNVSEAGDMLIFIAGATPIYGKQILYFMDPVFSARAKFPTPAESDRIRLPPAPEPEATTEGATGEDAELDLDAIAMDLEEV